MAMNAEGGGLGNELLDVGLDPAAYEALEKDFQEVSLSIRLKEFHSNHLCGIGLARARRRAKLGEVQNRVRKAPQSPKDQL